MSQGEVTRRVLIVDDDTEYGTQLQDILCRNYGFAAAFAGDLNAALVILRKYEFSVCLLDLKFGELNGLDIVERLLKIRPELKIIILTSFATKEALRYSFEKDNVLGFVTKDSNLNQIVAAVRNVQVGNNSVVGQPFTWMLDSYLDGDETHDPDTAKAAIPPVDQEFLAKVEALNGRHRRIFDALVLGTDFGTIGQAVGLKKGSLRTYASDIYRIFACSGRAELMMVARQAGYRPRKSL